MPTLSNAIAQVLYAGNVKKLVDHMCAHTESFNRELLADIAVAEGLEVTENMSKMQLCMLLQAHKGYMGLYDRTANAVRVSLQNAVAFVSGSTYLKSLINDMLVDMRSPLFQYVIIAEKPSMKDIRLLAAMLPYREASAFIQLQQLKTKYNTNLSALHMMLYKQSWSVGKMLFGKNPPYIVASNVDQEVLDAIRAQTDNIVRNLEIVYVLLSEDATTQRYLESMRAEERERFNSRAATAMHLAAGAAEGYLNYQNRKKSPSKKK